MISATLYQEGKNLTRCKVKGHSGKAEPGQDVVCAAVSVLTITCVNSLETICNVIPRVTEENQEKGIITFELPNMTEAENEKAQILMGALKQGFTDIAESEPEYFQLSIQTLSH